MTPPPHTSILFPYTTLFRSETFDKVNAHLRVFAPQLIKLHASSYRNGFLVDQVSVIQFRIDVMKSRYQSIKIPVIDGPDRKSTRLNSSHVAISYAVFCLKKK